MVVVATATSRYPHLPTISITHLAACGGCALVATSVGAWGVLKGAGEEPAGAVRSRFSETRTSMSYPN